MTGSPPLSDDEFPDIGKASDAPISGNGAAHPFTNGHDPDPSPKPVKLVPDQAMLLQFVEVMFRNARRDGFISFRVFDKNQKLVRHQALRLDDYEFVELMMILAEQAATWPGGAVFCPPVATFKNDLNAKTDNLREGVALSVESDQGPLEARATLAALLGAATIVSESGGEWMNGETGEIENKAHLHWRLKKPAATLEELAMLREARSLAARLVGADRTNISPVHPIRWPGSWHRKGEPRLAKIVAISEDTEIDLEEALEILRKAAEAAGVAEPVRTNGAGAGLNGSSPREASNHSSVAQALAVIPNGTDPKAHDWEYWNWTGMTIWASTDGSEEGRLAFHEWSKKSPRYNQVETDKRWAHYFRSPPNRLGYGSLVWRAREQVPDWRYENLIDPALEKALGELIALMLHERDEPDDEPDDTGNTGTAGSTAGSTAAADNIWDPWHEAPVPRLDMSLLPKVVREAAEVSAQVSGADVDAFAIGYLVGLTACGDARLQITPKQYATDWSVPLLLWVLLVAPPSSMKSEVIKKARSIAASLDAKERERYNADLTIANFGVSLKATEEKMTKAEEKKARIEAMQQVTPPRQRVCQDITIEKYVEILGTNPGGCASMREELAGWLGALGRYTANGNDGNDRSFYCHLHDGAPFDRQIKSAKDIHIEYCAGSFLGAVQADRLREFKLPVTDGLFQRFMPQMMREARGYQDSPESDDAKVLLRPVRDRLVALVPETETDPYGQVVAKPFKLTPEGALLYEKFANDMRIAARAGEPSIEFGECLQKMGPMWLSFALLFHLVEYDEKKPWGTTAAPARVVPTAIAKRADALIRGFFIPHAEHFYDLLSGGSAARRTRSLAVAILRCEKDDIVLRDVGRLCRAIREEKRDVQIGMMQRFETFGWLTRLDHTGNAFPRWKRAAGLKVRFEENLKREEAARAAMSEAIKADATANKGSAGG